jgi:hypothetical protein
MRSLRKMTVTIAAVVALAAPLGGTARAAFPGADGKIVFAAAGGQLPLRPVDPRFERSGGAPPSDRHPASG